MKLLMKINEDKRVIHCVKNLSPAEIEALENWGRMTSCDVLSYFKLPLFSISRGDLCYDFGLIPESAPNEKSPPEIPAQPLRASKISSEPD